MSRFDFLQEYYPDIFNLCIRAEITRGQLGNRFIMTECRSIIEQILEINGLEDGVLSQKIFEFKNNPNYNEQVGECLRYIKNKGNDAAHNASIVFSDKEAEQVLDSLCEFCKWYVLYSNEAKVVKRVKARHDAEIRRLQQENARLLQYNEQQRKEIDRKTSDNINYQRQIANNNEAEQYYETAMRYYHSYKSEKNDQLVKQNIEMAASKGHPLAAYMYAGFCLTGFADMQPDREAALRWYDYAYSLGVPSAYTKAQDIRNEIANEIAIEKQEITRKKNEEIERISIEKKQNTYVLYLCTIVFNLLYFYFLSARTEYFWFDRFGLACASFFGVIAILLLFGQLIEKYFEINEHAGITAGLGTLFLCFVRALVYIFGF